MRQLLPVLLPLVLVLIHISTAQDYTSQNTLGSVLRAKPFDFGAKVGGPDGIKLNACPSLASKFALGSSGGNAYGWAIQNRTGTDSSSTVVYILGSAASIQVTGRVVSWQIYVNLAGYTVYLQIWRRVPGQTLRYKLISQTSYVTTTTGSVTIVPKTTVQVKTGDLIGVYFPDKVVIPYTTLTTPSNQGNVLHIRNARNIQVHREYTFTQAPASWASKRVYSVSVIIKGVPDEKAQQWPITGSYGMPLPVSLGGRFIGTYAFGYSLISRRYLDTAQNIIVIPNPSNIITKSGFLVGWQMYIRRANQKLFLLVFRKGSGSSYTLVRQTAFYSTTLGLQTVYAQSKVLVMKGDVIGFYIPDYSSIPYTRVTCSGSAGALSSKGDARGVLTIGRAYNFGPTRDCRQYSFAIAIRVAYVQWVTSTVCPAGYQMIGRYCWKSVSCPEGYQRSSEGWCMKTTTVSKCPPGYNTVGNRCVPFKCPAGKTLYKGSCWSCDNPDYYRFDKSTGKCVAFRCHGNGVLVGGQCKYCYPGFTYDAASGHCMGT